MRKIGLVTVGRSDYGIYLPLLRLLHDDPEVQLQIIACGAHLLSEHGETVKLIEKDGFNVAYRVELDLSSDSSEGIAKAMAKGIAGFSDSITRLRPDLLVVLGDRFEMYTAALAALPFNLPVAHIHGGELTRGAMDDALRHSMTKLSHIHMVSCSEYGRRVRQLGEEDWRINVCGAMSVDNARSVTLQNPQDLDAHYGIQCDPPPLLVTFHPVTLEFNDTEWQTDELFGALKAFGRPAVLTRPNADTNNYAIIRKIREFVAAEPRNWYVDNLGTTAYFSLMNNAAAMVGNSSSGMVEAALFGLPVVNIGSRQGGRLRTANIIDVGYSKKEILEGLKQATSPELNDLASAVQSPFGDGRAAERIARVLKSVELGEQLIKKRFADLIMDGLTAYSVPNGSATESRG